MTKMSFGLLAILCALSGAASAADAVLRLGTFHVTFDTHPQVSGSTFLGVGPLPQEGAFASNVVHVTYDPSRGAQLCVRLATSDAQLQVVGGFDLNAPSGPVSLTFPLQPNELSFLTSHPAASVAVEVAYAGQCPRTAPAVLTKAWFNPPASPSGLGLLFRSLDDSPSVTTKDPSVTAKCSPTPQAGRVAFDTLCQLDGISATELQGTITLKDNVGLVSKTIPFTVLTR
ncbi:hypothetical protein GFL38_14135 [Rhizobium leguminosarum bv. viciae]|uniref:hypothetical protein n=1 Tax=Rhizobium ruizarguesonis TaxID=2081791 RepID=UPI00143F9025|nr:hypothetical protein [Rhizobium ruizarguesonis]NKJ73388.1 hypothetical protein [Rhizobium leguminosarum bv. viciae]NKQ70979.1 hypothetical protein [Rhizobium ruizarguesonis]NKQ78654.1 hypothetical protein [Rhizobium ruizarguesonis]